MAWVNAISIGGSLLGGVLGGKKNSDAAKQSYEDYKQNWQDTAQYNRPNQSTPWGSVNWTKDDNGNWTQTGTLDPSSQRRLDSFNAMAEGRMGAAGGIDLSRYSKPIDYDAIGLGALSKAAGGVGSTGARPYANNLMASMGGLQMGSAPQANLQTPQWGDGSAISKRLPDSPTQAAPTPATPATPAAPANGLSPDIMAQIQQYLQGQGMGKEQN